MRQPLDYPELTLWDLIAELPAWARTSVYLLLAFVMAAVAFMTGYLMSSTGA
jgi:hypothetical protein